MSCRIEDFRNKQVVCVKNGCVLGYISDVEFDTEKGTLESLVIFGRPRFFGLFGREDDIVISWEEVEVIGKETVLISTDPTPFIRIKNGKFGF